jgi:hypothetical protein
VTVENSQKIESERQFDDSPEGIASKWSVEMKAAADNSQPWIDAGDKTVKRFLDMRNDQRSEGDTRINLFSSNVQTLQALMYGKEPKVDVKRKFADPNDDVARIGGEVLQRMLNTDIERDSDTYATALENCLEDRLIPGLGQARVRYEVEWEEHDDVPAIPDTIDQATGLVRKGAPAYTPDPSKKEEDVDTDYVHWRDFRWSPCRTWDEVRWVAFKAPMTKDELRKRFPEYGDKIPLTGTKHINKDENDGLKNDPWSRADVWEIWNKEDRKVYWWVKGFDKILDIKDDPYELDGFFPCPRPLVANVTTTKFMPRADFVLAQDIYDEVDAVSTRITNLERAIAVRGVYDKTNEGVKRLLSETIANELIGIEGFEAFKEKGGLAGVVDWLPLDAIVNALQVLRDYRSELMQLLYQITGMSDIMRGQSTAGATATEQSLKAKFASVRVQRLQNDFARFASDIQALKAEIISKHVDPETIAKRSNIQYIAQQDQQSAQQAIALIKSDFYQYRIEVKPESVSMADMAAVKEERSEFLMAMSQFLQSTLPMAEAAPWSMPYLLQVLQWTIAGFRGGATIEGVLDQMVLTANQVMQQAQQNPQPNPEQQKMQMEQQKMVAQMQMDQQKAQVDIQAQQQKNQLEMAIKQMEAQMRKQELQMEMMAKAFGLQLEQKKLMFGMEVEQQKAQTSLQQTQMEGEISARQAEAEIRADTKKMLLDDASASMEHERAIANHEMTMKQAKEQHAQKLSQSKAANKNAGRKE